VTRSRLRSTFRGLPGVSLVGFVGVTAGFAITPIAVAALGDGVGIGKSMAVPVAALALLEHYGPLPSL
jgi:hypothetical protein